MDVRQRRAKMRKVDIDVDGLANLRWVLQSQNLYAAYVVDQSINC